MKISSLDLNNLPSVFFWDIDINLISVEEDYGVIISRVLMFTNEEYFENNISILENSYGKAKIINVIKNTKERISDDICTLAAIKYNTVINSKFHL